MEITTESIEEFLLTGNRHPGIERMVGRLLKLRLGLRSTREAARVHPPVSSRGRGRVDRRRGVPRHARHVRGADGRPRHVRRRVRTATPGVRCRPRGDGPAPIRIGPHPSPRSDPAPAQLLGKTAAVAVAVLVLGFTVDAARGRGIRLGPAPSSSTPATPTSGGSRRRGLVDGGGVGVQRAVEAARGCLGGVGGDGSRCSRGGCGRVVILGACLMLGIGGHPHSGQPQGESVRGVCPRGRGRLAVESALLEVAVHHLDFVWWGVCSLVVLSI